MALQFFQSLLRHSDASGSRSTVLKSLTWFLALLFALLGGLITLKAEQYVIIFIMALITLTSLVFLLAFGYCLFTDKDALRSEGYSIKKMQIENGILGDNTTGILPESQAETIDINHQDVQADEQSV